MAQATFILLSWEGPDRYSHAGGLGTRVTGLSAALASMGFETHLFFMGDPDLAGHSIAADGRLHLHRWCQWISHYHPVGVYDGEEGKLNDWNRSLPSWLESELIGPKVSGGGSVVILAEEWQTAWCMLALRDMLVRRGWSGRVYLLWNANNAFGFHRIPWDRLRDAAAITTVSKYMKHRMWGCGVDARVIPNGIPESWLLPVDRRDTIRFSRLFRGRLTLVKVARWDPDKRWDMAVDALAILKSRGLRPLLIARGGREDHGREVLSRARKQGLQVAFARWTGSEPQALAEAISAAAAAEPAKARDPADLVVLEGYLSEGQRKVLFREADAVLANSGIEPFGLVGLETMAVGGVAFVGCTGEDYVTHGHDAVSLQTSDPQEIVHHAVSLKSSEESALRLRQAAKRTAARCTWQSVIRRVLVPFLEEQGGRGGFSWSRETAFLRPWDRPTALAASSGTSARRPRAGASARSPRPRTPARSSRPRTSAGSGRASRPAPRRPSRPVSGK